MARTESLYVCSMQVSQLAYRDWQPPRAPSFRPLLWKSKEDDLGGDHSQGGSHSETLLFFSRSASTLEVKYNPELEAVGSRGVRVSLGAFGMGGSLCCASIIDCQGLAAFSIFGDASPAVGCGRTSLDVGASTDMDSGTLLRRVGTTSSSSYQEARAARIWTSCVWVASGGQRNPMFLFIGLVDTSINVDPRGSQHRQPTQSFRLVTRKEWRLSQFPHSLARHQR